MSSVSSDFSDDVTQFIPYGLDGGVRWAEEFGVYSSNPKTDLMPLQEYSDPDMEESKPPLTPEDVFDIAMDIGKEFEKLIALYSHESVTSLMPKILNVLELLEEFTCRSARDNSQLCELRAVISRLESEKLGKAAERERFEKELQQNEENWKEETRDLLDLVSRLREENRKLSSSLEEHEETRAHVSTQEQDAKVLHRMKDVIEQQREKLRVKEQELTESANETDSLRAQLEKTSTQNKDLRRRHKSTQNQTRLLIEEKAEMQAMLQEQQQCIQVLKQNLGVVQKDREDLAKAKLSDVDLTNKVVYDVDDPNRPRFTVDELKDILFERNELKARVSELQDEMDSLRPRSQQLSSLDDDDDDPPVQGPINKEPDDAPWKKKESGIRKLFRVLFGNNSNSSPSDDDVVVVDNNQLPKSSSSSSFLRRARFDSVESMAVHQ